MFQCACVASPQVKTVALRCKATNRPSTCHSLSSSCLACPDCRSWPDGRKEPGEVSTQVCGRKGREREVRCHSLHEMMRNGLIFYSRTFYKVSSQTSATSPLQASILIKSLSSSQTCDWHAVFDTQFRLHKLYFSEYVPFHVC